MACRYALGEVQAHTCYQLGCRSQDCRAAKSRYNARFRQDTAAGIWDGRVPAEPARLHILALRQQGMTLPQISRVSGISVEHLSKVSKNRHDTVQSSTADAILAVDPVPSKRFVSAVGSRRRLNSLASMGWAQRALAAEAGVSAYTIHRIASGHKTQLAPETATKITAAYDRLWDQPPLADTPMRRSCIQRSQDSAARNGFVPPLAWDDDEIDDPKAKPRNAGRRNGRVIVDEVAVDRLKRGQAVPVNILERRTAIAELADAGLRTGDIADRLGMTWTAAKRTRNRITAAQSAERRTA